MKTKIVQFLFGTLLFLPAGLLRAEVFQWTDSRGVIHFTDNLHSVPEFVRRSSHLTIRGDSDIGRSFSEIPIPSETAQQEPVSEAKAEEMLSPQGPEPAKVPPLVVHYNPQHTTIVVVNSIVRQPSKRSCEATAQSCPPSGFRPSFDDRRYIHPSVFDGGPQQYIQPELFPSTRR